MVKSYNVKIRSHNYELKIKNEKKICGNDEIKSWKNIGKSQIWRYYVIIMR